ncbi:MATH domain and coiled-coil domain-containing protein At3g58340 [Brassica rapa]|uniref:MATH domain and coiled-coil domain-containing protein At3g58340 n=1 Tax=Brassica campestris TaxID=3711 RepID=UPI00142E63DC|nr:MATH domain and coiled-coil domain-containing protein At3g58340 [Brassica rapa]
MMNPVDKKFGWVIKGFSSLQFEKCYSVPVLISDCKWYETYSLYVDLDVLFPKGNNGDYLSLYLDVADFETLPCGWRRYVKLRLTKPRTALMESRQFGVPAMLPLFKLENDGGFLVKGQVMIVAELDVFEVIGTFDDVVAAESSDLLKKTSLGINANGTKQVENSVKPPPKKTWNRKFDYCC